MAITASMQPESGRIIYAGSDFPHIFQFRFSKEGMGRRYGPYCAKLTRIRSGGPGQGLATLIRSGSKPVSRNHLARFLAGRKQPSYQFPTFRLGFHSSTDILDNIVQNQPGSDLILADCAGFGPNGSGPEASQCARIIWPGSGQYFPADPARMQIGCSMFTGLIMCSSHQYFSYHVTLTWNVWIQLQHSIVIMTYN